MFERIGTGWQLVQETWAILGDDKKLLVFPLMSMMACVAVAVSFAAPLWGSGLLDTRPAERCRSVYTASNRGYDQAQRLGAKRGTADR